MKMVGNDWENSLKWSKLIKKSSELFRIVSLCPKMPTSDASLSEQTCFFSKRPESKNVRGGKGYKMRIKMKKERNFLKKIR